MPPAGSNAKDEEANTAQDGGDADGAAQPVLIASNTDFPFESMSKADYKIVNQAGLTFGNDKIVTGKNYRPSFALSVSPETLVVAIPVKVVEDVVKRLSNSGENKEKTDFFAHFNWFENFT